MATEEGDKPRRPIEPLVSVVSDSVSLGYSALELVVEGLRESLRIQSGRGGPGRAGGARGGAGGARGGVGGARGSVGGGRGGARPVARPTVPLSAPHAGSGAGSSAALLGDLAAIAAELFGRAGAVAAEVANTVSERVSQPTETPSIPELIVDAAAGETTTLEFSVWNTGPTALRKVTLQATDLIGAEQRSLKGTITFRPPIVAQVGPGKFAAVEVDVAVPRNTEAGIYRGLIQAEPGDTCAVLMLEVKAAAPKRRAAAKPRSK
jgi:hypothetical protein